MIPASIHEQINHWLLTELGETKGISSSKVISGGCINDCLSIKTENYTFFIKYNFSDKFPGMFDAEAKGLELLRYTGCIRIPKVIYRGTSGIYSFLLLEFIEEGRQPAYFWEAFGKNLAKLHKTSHTYFGLDHDNYIGSIPQKNHAHLAWDEFLAEQRLLPLVKQSFDYKLLNAEDVRSFDRFIGNLRNLLPGEIPSLLHGDLWSGNFLVTSEGEVCLIDPAVYFGHREMDIAMTKLFGGFSPEFYQSYNQEYPLEKGWEKRVEINQLYPLLVHLLLFGAAYAGQIRRILKLVI
ncbi:MAG: fructosamine kinase family protein [Lentimicrobium sp.]|nr:fructosamine kinase family protein [Lentimicrobium sp.]